MLFGNTTTWDVLSSSIALQYANNLTTENVWGSVYAILTTMYQPLTSRIGRIVSMYFPEGTYIISPITVILNVENRTNTSYSPVHRRLLHVDTQMAFVLWRSENVSTWVMIPDSVYDPHNNTVAFLVRQSLVDAFGRTLYFTDMPVLSVHIVTPARNETTTNETTTNHTSAASVRLRGVHILSIFGSVMLSLYCML